MSHRSRRAVAVAVAAAAGLALTLAACAGAEPVTPDVVSPSSAAPGPDDVQYVALGDSYASAPGVPTTDPADGCFRSDSNYAHVLAETADLYLTDATCSGATSDEIIDEQVPVISADTDIVTVGTGGNDFDLFLRVLRSCLTSEAARGSETDAPVPGFDESDPAGDEPPSQTCRDVVDGEIVPAAGEIQAKMGEVLDAILEAAPDAGVYVVGYPTLLPESGTCPDLVPMAEDDYPVVDGVIRGLSDALRAEAEARQAPFVDVLAASQGHDICADEPWVNGIRVGDDGTAPFHPFAVEQAAVASLIADML